MRHVYGSRLLDQGVPVTAVSARLGHANSQITLKNYAHALPGQDQVVADVIGEVLREKGDSAEPDSNQGE